MEIVSSFEEIEKLKIEVLKQLSILLRNQITSQNFNKNMIALEQQKSKQINILLKSPSKEIIQHINNINDSLKILHGLQEEHHNSNINQLTKNLNDINNIFNQLLYEHNYATHDSLTELYNRHYFDKIMSCKINDYQKNKNKFSVLMIDLDDFKNINDSYGHATGDLALKKVADILLKSIRKNDLATRIGGDEFAVILIDTDLNQAKLVAEKIRKNITNIIINSSNKKKIRISASIGISNYPDTASDPLGLMSNMDIALYQAKTLGKNTVAIFNKALKFYDK